MLLCDQDTSGCKGRGDDILLADRSDRRSQLRRDRSSCEDQGPYPAGNRRDGNRPCDLQRDRAGGAWLYRHTADEEGAYTLHLRLLPSCRLAEDRALPRQPEGHGLHLLDKGWAFGVDLGRSCADREGQDHRQGTEGGRSSAELLSRRCYHQRRALQQGDRRLVERHEPRLGAASDIAEGRQAGLQYILDDAGLEGTRLHRADPPACGYAWSDGQAAEVALGRHRRAYREPDHIELQGRPLDPGVLHLDPRRP